jgi:hypothetical protein
MAKGYQGRHGAGAHRRPAAERTQTPTHLLPGLLRRPLVSAAAILAAAGACAAASSEAVPPPAEVLVAASPGAVAQAAQLSDNQGVTNNQGATSAAVTAVGISGVQRAAARTHREQAAKKAAKAAMNVARKAAKKAAADAATEARRLEARALERMRAAATRRVARAKVRRELLDRAQSDPRAVGRLLAADRGWSGEQFGCLNLLWTKESGWRWNADNPGSDAYGIPQALPGSKMSSAGSDWASNPATQITWGLQYISARYGSPCAAWAHSRSVNWY